MTTQPLISSFRSRPSGHGLSRLLLLCGAGIVLWATRHNPIWIIMAVASIGLVWAGARRVAGRRAAGSAGSAGTLKAGPPPLLATHGSVYRRLLAAHADRVALAGDQRIRLTDVYVDLEIGRADAPDDTHRPFAGTGGTTDRRKSFLSTVRKGGAGLITIVGQPGAGKTTALRRSAIELARHRVGKRRIPILLSLREHAEAATGRNPPSLPAVAARLTWLDGRIPAGWFRRQLAAGRCVVMCDGLDEVVDESDRQKMLGWLRTQARRYPKNSFVVTTRPAGIDSSAATGSWRLRRLSSVQVAAFAYAWCEAVESRKPGHTTSWVRDETAAEAGVLLSRLRATPALHELAANPLHLTLIALVHRHCGILPSSRAGLYADAAHTLLRRQPSTTARTARRLAKYLMDNKATHVTPAQLREALPQAPVTFLADAVDAGWLVPAGHEDGYSFTHTSFQYYLAALDMLDTDDATDVATRINDPWWRETLLIWAAHTDVTKVVETCLSLGNIDALALAFDMAEAAAGLAGEVRAELKELLGLATRTRQEHRLINAVKVSREMRGMRRLYGGARLSARPVSRDLYSAFLDAEYLSATQTETAAPVVGMWPGDAARFVTWLNSLPRGEDAMYWLPTESELAEPCRESGWDTAGHSVWVQADPHPRLVHSDGGKDPYTLARGWWRETVQADRRRATLLLYLLSTVLGPMSSRLTRDLAGQMNLERARAFALPRDLLRDGDLVAGRRFLRSADLTPGGRDIANPAALRHIDRVVDRVTELAAKALDFRADPAQPVRADLPFAYLAGLSCEQRHLLASAYCVLWLAARPSSGRLEYGQALGNLDDYLLRGIADAGIDHSQTVPPELLVSSLHKAHQSLKDDAMGHGGEPVWFRLARGLLARVVDRMSATLVHSRSYSVTEVVCARTALLAVSAAVREHARTGDGRLRPVLSHLSTAVAGLTVLEHRADGRIVPNEVIMLVRK